MFLGIGFAECSINLYYTYIYTHILFIYIYIYTHLVFIYLYSFTLRDHVCPCRKRAVTSRPKHVGVHRPLGSENPVLIDSGIEGVGF